MGKYQFKIGVLKKKITEMKMQEPNFPLFHHFIDYQRFIKSIENRGAFFPFTEILKGMLITIFKIYYHLSILYHRNN